jgi:hypothetical protein
MENQTDMKMKFKKFDGKDFSMWKAKVLNGLRFLGLHKWLMVKAEAGKTPDQVAPELRALAFVMDALSDNLFRQYQEVATLKELWDQLKTDYETSDMQRRTLYMSRLQQAHQILVSF